jgi:hypothetical protein
MKKKRVDPEKRIRLGEALICACSTGNRKAAEMLLDFGGDPNYVGTTLFKTPLAAVYYRRAMYRNNTDWRMMARANFEGHKFKDFYQMLKRHGLDERRLNVHNEPEEDYLVKAFNR